MDIKKLVRPNIRDLRPYEPGKPIEEVQRELGLEKVIKMASNENPLGPSPLAIKAIGENLNRMNFYPDGGGYYLKRKLSSFLDVDENQIILGNGSDEIIRMVVETFLNAGEEAVIAEQSFVIYQMAVRIVNGESRLVKLKDYRYDLASMAEAVGRKTKLVFVANPNNPTGTMVSAAEVESFMKKVPEDVIVVFDEAYFEYIERGDFPKTIDYIRDGRAIVCLRTFSKIYGLAGLRIGYGISQPEIISGMNRVRQPFNVNSVAQTAAIAALDDEEHVGKSRELNCRGRDFLYRELGKRDIRYIPSEANFILVEVGDGTGIARALLKEGVIVRDMFCYDLPGFIRVTVGLESENKNFIKKLQNVLHSS
jgi:histidinol-phosphate aminotransferase